MQKRLQIVAPGRLDRRVVFQELCADTWGLDNERAMSDTDGGRTGDEAAIWCSESPPGSERGMLTLGIDLSSRKRHTAACLLRWDGKSAAVEALRQGLENVELLPVMRDADTTAVDAPFGWPDGFREALAAWAGGQPWPLPWPAPGAMDALRLRETDRWIRDEHGKQALSVSSTGIAVTAWRAAALLSAFYGMDNTPLDRVKGRVREAYPGAALLAWQLLDPKETESYKKSAAVRARLLARMAPSRAWLRLTKPQRKQLIESDHQLDALVCALIARAAALGQTHRPPRHLDVAQVGREGWITHPLPDSWSRLARVA